MFIDAFFAQFFDDIPDPSQHAKIYYPFYDVLFLTVCAVIGGADGWEDIEDFGEVQFIFLGFNTRGCLKRLCPNYGAHASIMGRRWSSKSVRW